MTSPNVESTTAVSDKDLAISQRNLLLPALLAVKKALVAYGFAGGPIDLNIQIAYLPLKTELTSDGYGPDEMSEVKGLKVSVYLNSGKETRSFLIPIDDIRQGAHRDYYVIKLFALVFDRLHLLR